MPRSPAVILPSGETAEASAITNAAPPTARQPRCTRCQSLAKPSSLEYSHIGETAMRLRKVTPRMVSGEKSSGIIQINHTIVGLAFRPVVFALQLHLKRSAYRWELSPRRAGLNIAM